MSDLEMFSILGGRLRNWRRKKLPCSPSPALLPLSPRASVMRPAPFFGGRGGPCPLGVGLPAFFGRHWLSLDLTNCGLGPRRDLSPLHINDRHCPITAVQGRADASAGPTGGQRGVEAAGPPLEPGPGEGAARSLGARPRGGSRAPGRGATRGGLATGAPEASLGRGDRPRLPPNPRHGTACPPPFRFRAHLTRHISSDSAPPSHWPVPRPTGGSMVQLSHPSHPGQASGLLRPTLGPSSLGSTLIPTLLSHAPNPYHAPRPSWARLSSW